MKVNKPVASAEGAIGLSRSSLYRCDGVTRRTSQHSPSLGSLNQPHRQTPSSKGITHKPLIALLPHHHSKKTSRTSEATGVRAQYSAAMVREDLIEGAISFLQDPSVASAPVEQRVAFLRSKNLTQEEIDASLARVGQATPSQAAATSNSYQRQAPPPQQYGYQQQQQQPYWGQPPPEPPRRDWRDYFIMATVMGGLGYGLYWTTKRYITPLIAPPTPPQIEQDKASIDASFDKAFGLLDQLASDTKELKDAEKARTERLDKALSEVESVIGKMKEANEHRETESRRMAREMTEIREQIPKSIEKEREGTDARLKDLGAEMKSLKTLVANRMAGGAPRATPSYTPPAPVVNQTPTPAPAAPVAPITENNGLNGAPAQEAEKPAAVPERTNSSSPFGRTLGGKPPSIPAWQLAAKKRNEDAKKDAATGTQDVAQSGTATEAEAGA
jgi:peroxin-14